MKKPAEAGFEGIRGKHRVVRSGQVHEKARWCGHGAGYGQRIFLLGLGLVFLDLGLARGLGLSQKTIFPSLSPSHMHTDPPG